MPTGNRVKALVHLKMLPGAGRQGDDSGCRDADGCTAEGDRDVCCRGLERRLGEYGRTGLGRRDCGGGCNGGIAGSFVALPPTTSTLVLGQEDVGDGAAVEVGEILDGLHFGIRPTDLPERVRTGPAAQLRPFHGRGVTVRRLPV